MRLSYSVLLLAVLLEVGYGFLFPIFRIRLKPLAFRMRQTAPAASAPTTTTTARPFVQHINVYTNVNQNAVNQNSNKALGQGSASVQSGGNPGGVPLAVGQGSGGGGGGFGSGFGMGSGVGGGGGGGGGFHFRTADGGPQYRTTGKGAEMQTFGDELDVVQLMEGNTEGEKLESAIKMFHVYDRSGVDVYRKDGKLFVRKVEDLRPKYRTAEESNIKLNSNGSFVEDGYAMLGYKDLNSVLLEAADQTSILV